jgi:Ran GTPase-activating protein (RanGAP) involved in mRNA processing and transport
MATYTTACTINRSSIVYASRHMSTLWIRRRDNLDDRLVEAKLDQNLEVLQFYELEFTHISAAAVLEAFKRPWKEVQFHQCSGEVDVLIAKILAGDKVSRLSLFDCEELDRRAIFALRTGLKLNQGLTILRLEEVDRGWSDEMAQALGDSLCMNHTLDSLYLNEGGFDREPESIAALASGLKTNIALRILQLTRLGLHDDSIAEIATGLVDHPTLEELNLSKNYCRSRGCTAIAAMLSSPHTKLTKLDLSCQEIHHESESPFSVQLLAQALSLNSSLRILHLNENGLDDRAIEILAAPAILHSQLEYLDLRSNQITDNGIRVIATQLSDERSHHLKKLSLHGNPFGEQGGSLLLEALQSNLELEYLTIPGRIKCGKHIYHWLQLNKGGRKLLRASNAPLSLWPLALERVNRLKFWTPGRLNEACRANVMFSLLHGPAFLDRRRPAGDMQVGE